MKNVRKENLDKQTCWIKHYEHQLNETIELFDNLVGMQKRLKEKIDTIGACDDYCTISNTLLFMLQSILSDRTHKSGIELESSIANDNVIDLNGLYDVEILDKKKDEFYERIEHMFDKNGNVM